MTTPVFQPQDADQFLVDFGVDLVVQGAPTVTRGMLDDAVEDREGEGGAQQIQRVVLKLKRGALGALTHTDRRVTVDPAGVNLSFAIAQRIPRPSSLFDYYVLKAIK